MIGDKKKIIQSKRVESLNDKRKNNKLIKNKIRKSKEIGVEEELLLEGEERIKEPYDPTKSQIDTKIITIDLLIKRINENEIDLAPSFQRKAGLWSLSQKSRLIESLLIRIPLPAFYFDATDDSRWIVVDGLQRLTTFKEYILNKIYLTDLEFLTQYEGKYFKDLPRHLRRRIEESQVTIHLIQPGTPSEVKFNIFRRINTGGLVLTAQEIRHALNQGPVIDLLNNLANSEPFLQATHWSIPSDRMMDREFILRFLAFTITPYAEYKIPDMDAFLNEQMAKLNKMVEQEYNKLEIIFEKAMNASINIFGSDAFRKRYRKNDGKKPINKALFESWSVCLGKLQDPEISILLKHKNKLIDQAINKLNKDKDYEKSITQSTKDVLKVRKRFKSIDDLVKKVLKGENHD